MTQLNAEQLRKGEIEDIEKAAQSIERRPIYFILENVYDTYNIGSFFRLADAVASSGMYLCGDVDLPPNHKIVKASVGTYKTVAWHHKSDAEAAITELRETVPGIRIVAIEQTDDSTDYLEADYTRPICFVVGNESRGVIEDTLTLCDAVVEVPMFGVNKSLNVIVAAGIVVYQATTA